MGVVLSRRGSHLDEIKTVRGADTGVKNDHKDAHKGPGYKRDSQKWLDASSNLFVAQGLNWFEVGGPVGRIKTEEDADPG